MPRLTLVLAVLVGVLAGGLAVALVPRGSSTDEAAVRAIVSQAMADSAAASEEIVLPPTLAALDPAELNPLIEQYLMANPRLLERMSNALNAEIETERKTAARLAIAEHSEAIFNDPDAIVLGNPNGDVTLVEMFDYNCGYCRQSLPDIATLLADDPNLRIVLKEFPILSQGSVDAAQIGVLVSQADVDYWAYHQALFTSRGQVTKEIALRAAADLGLSAATLETGMKSEPVSSVLEKSFQLADALQISGTPTFIIGDEIIPGAIGLEGLKKRIANMRACGSSTCDQASL